MSADAGPQAISPRISFPRHGPVTAMPRPAPGQEGPGGTGVAGGDCDALPH